MTYDEAIYAYDKMDNLQRAGVHLRLHTIARRVPDLTPAKEVLRLAVVEELQQLPLE